MYPDHWTRGLSGEDEENYGTNQPWFKFERMSSMELINITANLTVTEE
jgi:hypothetical protein